MVTCYNEEDDTINLYNRRQRKQMTRSQPVSGAREKSRFAGSIEKETTPPSQNLTKEARYDSLRTNQEIPRTGPSTRTRENSTNGNGAQFQGNEYANLVSDDRCEGQDPRDSDTDYSFCKIISWNIAGLKKYSQDTEFKRFLKTFNIIHFSETWSDKKDEFVKF